MFYKPNYCCNCGEKVERANWSFTTSRRFCDVCQEDFKLEDLSPKIFAVLMSIVGIFGAGAYLWSDEKPVNDISKQLSARNSNQIRALANRPINTPSNANNQLAANINAPTANREVSQLRQDLTNKNELPPIVIKEKSATESVYFCGAMTKKSSPCSRRVKGNGRCWQHKGQNAVLPPEKLIISQ